VAVDFEAEGLLEGLEDERSREARLELLRQLHEDGVSLDELREAVAEERLAILPVERVLDTGELRYTAAEIAERSGLEGDYMQRARRALGLPVADDDEDGPAYTEGDLEMARGAKQMLDAGLPEEGLLEAARVLGQGMARYAEAVRDLFGPALIREGDTELDLGLRYAAAARELKPLMAPWLDYVYAIQQRELIRRDVIGQTELAAGELPGSQHVTCCFADLTGFTRLGEEVPPGELGAVAGRLAELAFERAQPPVRVIKMIGDAAMLVSREPEPILDAALDLVDAVEDEGEEFPQLRAGLAAGEALTRGGDWYGRPVNLSSRITGVARPGSVLVDRDLRDAVERERYAWSRAGRRRLKGVSGEVSLYRVRRPRPE
jgi:adenylate cyclase